ncbi:uncharacterized protein LOC141630430 [Silene latifolia]|uniref:uncharacterized protein LOC141630430 n=1 Tax=Silene latifolia TaxID=37657 RepID=UPI003D76F5E4
MAKETQVGAEDRYQAVEEEEEARKAVTHEEIEGNCKVACRLFYLQGKQKVDVARGYMFAYDRLQQVKVHGIPLRHNCSKVEVSQLYKDEYGEVKVPFPNEEITYLKEAPSSYVQWPNNLINVVIPEKLSKAMAAVNAITTTSMEVVAVKPAYDSYYESCEYKKKMKTALLMALHNLAVKKSPRGDVVMINIEEEIMGAADIAVLDPK